MTNARAEQDWPFSLIGNEAENLRAAVAEADGLQPTAAVAVVEWIDRARWHWIRGGETADWQALHCVATAYRAFGIAQYAGSDMARRAALASIGSRGGRRRAEASNQKKDQARRLWDRHSSPGGLKEFKAWRELHQERGSQKAFARFLCERFGFVDVENVSAWITTWRREQSTR